MTQKAISFRPTEHSMKVIREYMNTHTNTDRTKAINALLIYQHTLPVESTKGNQNESSPNRAKGPLLCLDCVYTYRKKPPAKFAGKPDDPEYI